MSTVTIGMPVRNGADVIGEALASLRTQEFKDFVLVISDNASDDDTERICREAAAADARIAYERLDRDIGAVANFARVLRHASSTYFMWAAHDDVWAPQFLSRCVAALDAAPAAVAAVTAVEGIFPDGHIERLFDYAQDVEALSRRRRFRWLLQHQGGYWAVYGLFRHAALATLPPMKTDASLLAAAIGPEIPLTLELGLIGPFTVVSEPLFRARTRARYDDLDTLVRKLDPDAAIHVRARPLWRFQRELARLIARREQSRLRRAVLRADAAAILLWEPFWRHRFLTENFGAWQAARTTGRFSSATVLGLERLLLDPLTPLRRLRRRAEP